MTQIEVLQWLEVLNTRQAKNDFNVADVPASILIELKRRKFAANDIVTAEGIKFIEKHKVKQ
jgi:hypothetical protein